MAECCRCGRRRHKAGTWPDGHVCRTCSDRAVRTRGTCPEGGEDRALPGLRPGDGAAICTTCAGFSQTFDCSRCGFEGKLLRGRLCERCTLTDRLTALLDDGTGRIRPALVPLIATGFPSASTSTCDRRRCIVHHQAVHALLTAARDPLDCLQPLPAAHGAVSSLRQFRQIPSDGANRPGSIGPWWRSFVKFPRSRTGANCGLSPACPGVRTNASGRQRRSAATWILLVSPPRERPSSAAFKRARCRRRTRRRSMRASSSACPSCGCCPFVLPPFRPRRPSPGPPTARGPGPFRRRDGGPGRSPSPR
jgi:hypothetical protein